MRTLELYSGTASFSNVMRKLGHGIFTVDNDPRFSPDMCADILKLTDDEIVHLLDKADTVWMSPPCTTFSLASGNRHWTSDRQPKTDAAREGLAHLMLCKKIADYCIDRCKIFFIENPNGRAVWFLPSAWLHKVWYCQYGDRRAKPTNIWTNLEGWQPKTCRNNNPDCHHERAKRGSKTGTQGQSGAKERGRIPEQLIYEIEQEIRKNFR